VEQERDYLDKVLCESFIEIQTDGRFGEGYNKRLIEKLHGEKSNINKIRTAAISLITAGFLMGFMYTTEVQYGMAKFEYKLKADFAMMKHSVNLDKYFLGE
jgi:hypothetical protein